MKKLLSAILVLSMMLVMLVGCGNASTSASSEPPADSAASAPAEETEVTDAPAPVEESPAEPSTVEAAVEAVSVEEPVAPEIPEVEYPLTDDPVTLTLWYSFPGDLSDIMEEYYGQGKSSVLQAIADRTGVSLAFMLQSVQTASDNFNLMVASQDYPELLYNPSSYYTGGMDKAIDDEVLVDLTDLLPEYAPNYYAKITADDDTYNLVQTSSGRFAEIMRLESEYTKSSTGMVIRQDWLDDLGLDTPTTLDEFHDVLKAFKEEKGAIEPLGMNYTGVLDGDEIASAFDTYGTYADFMGTYPIYVIDDQVKFGWIEDSFKEYLTTMHEWYDEGLLGKDYYAENTGHGIDTSKTTTGEVGVWLNDYFQIDLVQSEMVDTNADLEPIAAPVMNAGDTLHFVGKRSLVGGNSWGITTNCENVELALQYCDYFFTDEGSILCNYGVEGEGMTYDADGNPTYTELVYNNPDHTMRETQVMYTLTVGPFVEVESRSDVAYSEKEVSARTIWDSNQDDAYSMPTTSLDAEQAAEVSGLMGDILTYASGKITEFIIGSDSLDNWDAYIQSMKDFNIDRVIEIYQGVYDAYVA